MKKLPVAERILFVLFILAVLAFPVTGQYALSGLTQGLDWIFQQAFIYSWVVVGVFAVYLLMYCGFRYANLTKVNIPKKGVKTAKAGKYIA